MKLFYKFLYLVAASTSLVIQAEVAPIFQEPEHLVVNNRILAKVNGKTISVLDVMKKMDVFLNRYYPQHIGSKVARFQFYSTNWRETLDQMIDNELILADAEAMEVKVTDGDVREMLQERFGPNVMSNLDKIGITYEEARKMIHSELIVQRMTWFKINAKAHQNVNPQEIKAAYRAFCVQHPPKEQWKYQVISVRAAQGELGKNLADKAFDLLSKHKEGLQTVAETLQHGTGDLPAAVTVSEEYVVDEKDLSQSHKAVLTELRPNSFSPPVSQLSRADNSQVFRIFYLKEHLKEDPHKFEEVSNQIKDELLQKESSKEGSYYIAKLRERFGYDQKNIDEMIPSDLQPFTLN